MADWTGILDSARTAIEQARPAPAARFLASWPVVQSPRAVVAATLPVLRWLGPAAGRAPVGPLRTLAGLLADAAAGLRWRQTYHAGQLPPSFLNGYGWCELFGREGPVPSEALAGGVLLLGPQTHYPSHHHVAEELYVPLSGTAGWQRGEDGFELRQPGEAILHAGGEPHAMRTAADPLLAFYLWRGDGLGDSATLTATAARNDP